MKNVWRSVVMFAFIVLLMPCACAQELFQVSDDRVSARLSAEDGFEIILDLPVLECGFDTPVSKMTAGKYHADINKLEQVWNTYTSLNGAAELSEPQVFVDQDGKVTTQYVYSDRATQMVFQIVGIRPPYRRQEELPMNAD